MMKLPSDEEKTMFAVKLNRSHTEIVWLIAILGGLCTVIGLIGAAQYYNCYKTDSDITLKECFSATKMGRR